MIKGETAEEFIKRLKSLPKLDLTDKKTFIEFGNRIDAATREDIEMQSRLLANSLGRSFTKVVR